MNWLTQIIESLKSMRLELIITVAVLLIAGIILLVVMRGKKGKKTKGWTAHQLGTGALWYRDCLCAFLFKAVPDAAGRIHNAGFHAADYDFFLCLRR